MFRYIIEWLQSANTVFRRRQCVIKPRLTQKKRKKFKDIYTLKGTDRAGTRLDANWLRPTGSLETNTRQEKEKNLWFYIIRLRERERRGSNKCQLESIQKSQLINLGVRKLGKIRRCDKLHFHPMAVAAILISFDLLRPNNFPPKRNPQWLRFCTPHKQFQVDSFQRALAWK